MSETANTTPIAPLLEREQMFLHDAAPDDLPFIRLSWRESFKQAVRMHRIPWSAYKATAGKVIDELIASTTTRKLGAYDASNRMLGWVVWSPGAKISALHYVYTRHDSDGTSMRRRGVATALLTEADLGKRFLYTFPGPKRQRGAPMDEVLVAWGRSRGVFATHVPIEEFLKP